MKRLIIAATMVMLFAGCMAAGTPAIEMGEGEDKLPTPTYHGDQDTSLRDDWRGVHPDEVTDGGVTKKFECLLCHDPATSCDNCHTYVGAKHVYGSHEGGEANEH